MKHRRGIDLTAPVAPARYEEPDKAFLEKLSSLQEWEVLGAKCGACGRIAWLDKQRIMKLYGNHFLRPMGDKLVCLCGNRKGNTVLIGRLGRD